MYPGVSVLVLAAIGLSSGALVPQIDTKDEINRGDPGNSQVSASNQPQSYPLQANSLPGQYYYPTYPDYSGANGYSAIPSGYDGYLVPAAPVTNTKSTNWISDVALSLLPGQGLVYGARAGIYLLNFLVMISLGGLFTVLLCSFTPLCSISFPGFSFHKDQVKEQVAELARTYITPETVNVATILMSKAIDKYATMQQEQMEKELTEASPLSGSTRRRRRR